MSNAIELQALPREESGKADSRRLRLSGSIPGVVYGKTMGSVSFTMIHKDFNKNLEDEKIYTSQIDLSVGKKKYKVLLKDIQRHPYKKQIMHVDFLHVTAKTVVTVNIPVHLLNEDTCAGVKNEGGIIGRMMTDVEIKCAVGNLPESIEIDIQNCNVGDVIHLSDLSIPKGSSIPSLELGRDLPVVRVSAASTKSLDEEVESSTDDAEGAEEEKTEESK